jgi:hypothetical protein
MTVAADKPKAPEEGQGGGGEDQALSDRVGQLETGQQGLTDKVDKILGILDGGGKGGGHAPDATADADGAGNPASVAHEIRQQLDAAEARRRRDEAEAAKDGRLAAAEAKIAELSEKPPAPLPRRVTKVTWGE